MSYFIRIFCTTDCSMNRDEFIEFISDGVFFDDEPKYDPPPESPESKDPNWNTLTVHYNANLRPVIFERNAYDDLQKKEIEEFLFILSASRETKAKQYAEMSFLYYEIASNNEECDKARKLLDSIDN